MECTTLDTKEWREGYKIILVLFSITTSTMPTSSTWMVSLNYRTPGIRPPPLRLASLLGCLCEQFRGFALVTATEGRDTDRLHYHCLLKFKRAGYIRRNVFERVVDPNMWNTITTPFVNSYNDMVSELKYTLMQGVSMFAVPFDEYNNWSQVTCWPKTRGDIDAIDFIANTLMHCIGLEQGRRGELFLAFWGCCKRG